MLLRNNKSYNGMSDPLQGVTTATYTNGYPSDPCPLARLPRELRDEIYEYALGIVIRTVHFHEMIIAMIPLCVATKLEWVNCEEEKGFPEWMLSSKTMLSEAVAVIHRTQYLWHLANESFRLPTQRNPLVLNQNIRHVKLSYPLELVGDSFPSPRSWHPGWNDDFLHCLAVFWNAAELHVRCNVRSQHPDGPRLDLKDNPYGRKPKGRNSNSPDYFKQLRGRCSSLKVKIKVPCGNVKYPALISDPEAWAHPVTESKRQHFAAICQSVEEWARDLIGGSTHLSSEDKSDEIYFRFVCEVKKIS